MFRIVCFLILNFSFFTGTAAADATYVKVKAKNGDGVYKILRNYDLADDYCNIKQFYRLNNLEKDANLLIGKNYFIPILIYSYNDKNIRSSISKDDFDLALGIQKYNEKMLAKGMRSVSYRKDKKLWVPFSSLYCGSPIDKKDAPEAPNGSIATVAQKTSKTISKETKPAAAPSKISAERTYKVDELFGKKYEKYQEADQSLKDKVFYIVSGHGGPDPGAVCTTCPQTLCEDEYAYDVALRLARNLKQHGAIVEMIIQDKNDGIRDEQYLKCDRDERCNGNKLPVNQKKRLRQRSSYINQLHAKYKKKGYKDHALIVLHVDSAGKGKQKDVFFYHHKNSKKGKEMAHNIHNTFESKYARFQKGRGYKGTIGDHRNLHMITQTNPPIVFIELANIQNHQDLKRILPNSNRQALANWIFLGLIK